MYLIKVLAVDCENRNVRKSNVNKHCLPSDIYFIIARTKE